MKQAQEWIHAEAERRSIEIRGVIEQPHLYPWSTILVVPTDQGRLFFKATAPETIHEAALTQKLAQWFPDCMPELVAVDVTRGWMLMRHGGEQLRKIIRPAQDIQPWAPVIERYAEVQVGLAGHVTEILALGLPDHRPMVLPSLYSMLLRDKESLMLGREKGVTATELRQLEELALPFEQLCTDLAGLGIPDSINHGDFHDGNVLLKDGRITFFDWGDASVAHPLISLRTFLVSIEMALNLDEYSFTPEMAALVDHYLRPWQTFASKNDVSTAYELSRPAASIAKALAWRQTISHLPDSMLEQYAWIVPEVLREFLHYMK